MNSVVLVGRLTKDPDVRYTGEKTAMGRYTLAVDRRFKREGQPTADFISCVVFGAGAEFAEKYFTKGMRIAVSGRIQTGSYKDKDGRTVYTTDVVVEAQEFAQNKEEAKAAEETIPERAPEPADPDGFMKVPDTLDEELPFA